MDAVDGNERQLESIRFRSKELEYGDKENLQLSLNQKYRQDKQGKEIFSPSLRFVKKRKEQMYGLCLDSGLQVDSATEGIIEYHKSRSNSSVSIVSPEGAGHVKCHRWNNKGEASA